MKVNPIINPTNFRKPTFKGYFTPSSHSIDTHGQPYDKAVEKTDGYHAHSTGYNYYADPMEYITDSIREKADNIIYDLEPEFPDINNSVSKDYFGRWQSANASGFKPFQSYFYRLEMADRKTVAEYENKYWNNVNPQESREKADYYRSRVADAQYNQETAANCISIHEESAGLRNQKYKLEYEAQRLVEERGRYSQAVKNSKLEIEKRKQLLELINSKISQLETLSNVYSKLIGLLGESQKFEVEEFDEYNAFNKRNSDIHTQDAIKREWIRRTFGDTSGISEADQISMDRLSQYNNLEENFKQDENVSAKDKTKIEAQLVAIKKRLEFYKDEAADNKAVIAKLENILVEFPKKIKKLSSDITKMNETIVEIKGKLIPYFDKLKNYFYSRGIKTVR